MKPPLFSHAKIRSFPGSQCPIFRQIQSFTNVSSDFICHIPRNRIALNQQTDKTMESISLKLIFRSWWRNKTFAVISLLSLAAGITCTNLLISYVIYESRIEAHNPNKSHIIYMAQDSPLTSGEKVSFIKGKIPVQLKDQYPEVEDYLRLNIENAASITIGEKHFDPISIVRADPSFPRFFPYKVVAGDINKALTQPNAIALTEYQAKIFFGNEDPIGKTFSAKYTYENETITYEVAAVIKEYPQSFLKFNALAGTTSQFNGGPTLLLVNDLFNIDTFTQKLRMIRYLLSTEPDSIISIPSKRVISKSKPIHKNTSPISTETRKTYCTLVCSQPS